MFIFLFTLYILIVHLTFVPGGFAQIISGNALNPEAQVGNGVDPRYVFFEAPPDSGIERVPRCFVANANTGNDAMGLQRLAHGYAIVVAVAAHHVTRETVLAAQVNGNVDALPVRLLLNCRFTCKTKKIKQKNYFKKVLY